MLDAHTIYRMLPDDILAFHVKGIDDKFCSSKNIGFKMKIKIKPYFVFV